MSWKASAYVKEITHGITPSEKLVLFVLADYHNTSQKAAWPNLKDLASESLLTESGLCRLLDRIEAKGFIKRISGGGRGNRTLYIIPGVDPNTDRSTVFSEIETLTETALNTDRNTDRGDSPYKEEPVLEPQTSILSSPPVPTGDLVLKSDERVLDRPKKKQTPPRGDPRHSPFLKKLNDCWVYLNPGVPNFSWSGGEVGQLAIFLRKWPKLTIEEFHDWLMAYCDSDDIVPSKTPMQFLPFIHEYATGPRDKFHHLLRDDRAQA